MSPLCQGVERRGQERETKYDITGFWIADHNMWPHDARSNDVAHTRRSGMISCMPLKQASPEVVLLLSGGMDSATVLTLLQHAGRIVSALFIDHGQLAAEQERQASRRLAVRHGVPWSQVAVTGLEKVTFGEVRGRNDLLIALAVAHSPAPLVAVGVHAGTRYVDCSPAHQGAWQALLDVQHGGSRRLLAPLRDLTKAQVLALAREVGVPLRDTYSCEDARGPCGQCISCRDRGALDACA